MSNGFVNNKFSADTVESPNHTTSNVPFVKYGTCSVTGDGTLYLARSNSLFGRFQISWSGSSRSNVVTIDFSIEQYSSGGFCTIINNYAYQNQVVLSDFRIVKEGASNYLTCTISNRNSGTSSVSILAYSSSSITFAPDAPTTSVDVTNNGFQSDVYGNYTFPGIVKTQNILATSESITATSETVAASLDVITTKITTNGDSDLDIVSLAAGTADQVKIFTVSAVGNVADSVKIVPANLIGGTQITFSASPLGKGCTMIYDGVIGGWVITGSNGGVVA